MENKTKYETENGEILYVSELGKRTKIEIGDKNFLVKGKLPKFLSRLKSF
jgi:hypothetical protein